MITFGGYEVPEQGIRADATMIAERVQFHSKYQRHVPRPAHQAVKLLIQLGTNASCHTDRARAAEDLLHAWGAVAAGLVGLAVELLAARAGAQNIVLVGKGVAKFTIIS